MAELPKLYIDNPGGDWLQRKLEAAQEDYRTAPLGSSRRNIGASDITGYFKTALDLSPDLLKDLPGALGEEAWRETSVKLENLEKRIREQGYEPSPILINVREDGTPFIVEGNHRVAEALKSGRTSIPVELRYLRGAEDAEGPLSLTRLQRYYESRPKDQSNLPAVIDAASVVSQLARTQADEPRPKGKGEVFRGIGSLMRGRMFPIIRAAQAGWETLSPEVKAEIEDYLKRPAHELFGMDKPGIEYFKELLGISPEDLGETIPLPGPPQETVELRPKGLSEPSYHTYDQETRDYWDTHLEHNALRQNPKTGWAAERSYLLEAAGDVLRELTGSTGFIASGGTEKGYLNEKLNRLKREARTVSPKYMAERRYEEGLGGPAFGPAEGEKEQLEDIGISIARIKPKSEEAALAKSILSNIADSDSYLLNSNIDKLRRKLGLLSEEELDRLINEPRPKAAGGFIDKPLYEGVF